APNQQGRLALLVVKHRRRVAIVVLGRDLVIARLLPTKLPGGFVEPRDPGWSLLLQSSQNDVPVGEDGRTALVPEQMFTAETFDKISLPVDSSLEVQRGKNPALKVDVNLLPVRHGRSIAAGAEGAMLGRDGGSQPGTPKLLASEIERQDSVLSLVGSGKNDPAVPNYRR